jgi:uncharacterized protein
LDDIKNKLQAMLAGKGVMSGADWKQRQEQYLEQRRSGALEVQPVLGGTLHGEAGHQFYLLTEEFPCDAVHGCIPFSAALDAIAEHIAFTACDDTLDTFDPRRTAFVDTETTGLAGGAGTVAFLIGVAYFDGDVLRLEQCFMRDYDDEEPMLAYLGELFKRFDTVVSYNGKSFDLPLLRTRFIQNRIPARLDALTQFDLLHAARRFWKRRLAQCNLTNIERHILQIHRQGDVPSELIPRLWFDYLRARDARPLERVFSHHKTDILSLVALTGWLAQCMASEGRTLEHTEDQLSLVRLYFRQRKYDEVLTYGRATLERVAETHLRRECLELMALACKRAGDFMQMADYWLRVLQETPRDFVARHELAKYYEHRARDLAQAERVCLDALDYLQTRAGLGRLADADLLTQTEFQRRLDRIRKKIARAVPIDGSPYDFLE